MLSQDELRARFEERVVRAGRMPPDPRDAGRVGAVAVLRDFSPGTFARSAVAFAREARGTRGMRGTRGDWAAAWYAGFTRTIFLAGDPRNLLERHPCRHLDPDGDIAWYGPGPLADHGALRRLLRPFQGPLGVAVPFVQEIPLDGGEAAGSGLALLEVSAAGLPVEDYLVNVNHLLAEAVLDGLLDGTGRLLIRHVAHEPDPPAGYDRIRVTADPRTPGRLRAHACLRVG
ncbi:DUF6182 family protein [Actinomadura fibrosa]|uniref:DUF6182 family protein n=1 Tax=Actinomadura fibrosa TaxID=111802 RepID=A0ABW2XYC8_9ACTN|nr:DUF6182 family protein [Actinomadura fibrosa]